MYDERIEGLINAALADGELTEKEKQILFKNAQAQGIDLDEFEMVLDARLVELKRQQAKQLEKTAVQQSAPKSDKFGDVRKCPACGAILQSFQTKCDECGYEFKNVGSVNSAQKLFDLLQASELRKSERRAARDNRSSISKVVDGLMGTGASYDNYEEQATIIRNFPVPNTTEDLLELLAMATSNAYDNDGVVGLKEEVWLQKADQIYQKVIVCAANDKPMLEKATRMVASLMKRLPDERYKKFTNIPTEMKDLIDEDLKADSKRRRDKVLALVKKYGIISGPCLLLGIILMAIGSAADSEACNSIGCLLFIAGCVVAWLGWKAWKKLKASTFF